MLQDSCQHLPLQCKEPNKNLKVYGQALDHLVPCLNNLALMKNKIRTDDDRALVNDAIEIAKKDLIKNVVEKFVDFL